MGRRFFIGGVGLVVRFVGVFRFPATRKFLFVHSSAGRVGVGFGAGAIPICAGCGLLCLYGYELGAARGPWGYGARCVE